MYHSRGFHHRYNIRYNNRDTAEGKRVPGLPIVHRVDCFSIFVCELLTKSTEEGWTGYFGLHGNHGLIPMILVNFCTRGLKTVRRVTVNYGSGKGNLNLRLLQTGYLIPSSL